MASPAKDESLVATMIDHFRTPVEGSSTPPDCLPFPAGPLLPRQQTHSPPLIAHGLSNGDRIKLGYTLWPQELDKYGETNATSYVGTLTRLHLLAAGDWCNLHGKKLTPDTAMVDVWTDFLLIERDVQRNSSGDSIQEDRNSIVQRIKSARRKLKIKHGAAYSGPGYACQCHAPAIAPSTPEGADLEALKTAQAACKKDPWGMLMRFWFKQLHSHHSIQWDTGLKLKYIRPYHSAALGLVHTLRHQPSHPLASVAKAFSLARLLPPLELKSEMEWYKKMGNPLWSDGLLSLPPALCPETMGDPLQSFQWMQKQAKHLGIAPELIADVDTLAREVASLMTDPWVMCRLGWYKKEVEALATRLTEQTKPRKEAEFIASVDPRSNFSHVLDRRRAMQKFLQWSSFEWHQHKQKVENLQPANP